MGQYNCHWPIAVDSRTIVRDGFVIHVFLIVHKLSYTIITCDIQNIFSEVIRSLSAALKHSWSSIFLYQHNVTDVVFVFSDRFVHYTYDCLYWEYY